MKEFEIEDFSLYKKGTGKILSKKQQRDIIGRGGEWECIHDSCSGSYSEPGFANYFMNCGEECDHMCQHCLQCGQYDEELLLDGSCDYICNLC